MSTDRVVVPDADALATMIADRIGRLVASIQAGGREPHVVLTGGSIAIETYARLDADAADWARVHWWWGDERFVPAGHHDRNAQQAYDAFLHRFSVPDDHVHAMPAASERSDPDESMAAAADAYGDTLPSAPFDLVLLGMGPDSHVASLFPGFPQLDETERRCVEVFGSPKPPPERITLTFPALNHAVEVWLLVAGGGKAEAVARAWGDGPVADTPAKGVRGLQNTLWLLDEAAASQLS